MKSATTTAITKCVRSWQESSWKPFTHKDTST